jgi:hypothetical protein
MYRHALRPAPGALWALILFAGAGVSAVNCYATETLRNPPPLGLLMSPDDFARWTPVINTFLFTVGGTVVTIYTNLRAKRATERDVDLHKRIDELTRAAEDAKRLAARQVAEAKAESERVAAAKVAEAKKDAEARLADAEKRLADMKTHYDAEIKHLWANIQDRAGVIAELKKHGITPPSDFELPCPPNTDPGPRL